MENKVDIYDIKMAALTLCRNYMALSPYVWTDRLIVNAQGQKQVIHINLLQYLLTPLLA